MTKNKTTRSGAAYDTAAEVSPPAQLTDVTGEWEGPAGGALAEADNNSPPYATPGLTHPNLQAGIDANAADIRAIQARLDSLERETSRRFEQLMEGQTQSEERIISFMRQSGFQRTPPQPPSLAADHCA